MTAGVSVGLIASIGASFLAVRRAATKAAAGGPEARGRGRNIGELIAFVVGIGAAATIVTSVAAAHRALRTPAVEAVSPAA
ncbi:hypothetical protein [Streptomyces niveus]|uniref:hypothetical protein n=1 Tax=Streptomyces niveus TaxID=193462 RepID=UPI003653456A